MMDDNEWIGVSHWGMFRVPPVPVITIDRLEFPTMERLLDIII